MPQEFDRLPWHERQAEPCGYTPKCCSCVWCQPLDPWEKPLTGDTWGNCTNPVQNKGLSAGRHQVEWRDRCFQFEWIHAVEFEWIHAKENEKAARMAPGQPTERKHA